MKRKSIIHSFFKSVGSIANSIQAENPNVETPNVEVETNDHVENLNNHSSAEHQPIVASAFERDPGKRI
jgi:hypothetical protein